MQERVDDLLFGNARGGSDCPPLATHWGTGQKASADMMSLDVSRHLWIARVDPRRRTYATGIYTHVLDKWGIVYDQPIVLNERQAGVAIEGVEQHNRSEDRIRLSLLAVDTHGYTNAAMALAKGLSFDLCPRLRDLAERKLYLPTEFKVPEGIERVTTKRLSLRAIRLGWEISYGGWHRSVSAALALSSPCNGWAAPPGPTRRTKLPSILAGCCVASSGATT